MKGDDDLGVMRRRAFGHHHRHLPSLLNLMPPAPLSSCASSSSSPPVAFPCPKTTHYCSTWKKGPTAEMSGRGAAGPLLLLGQEIDVNSEEDARASSPNSALSTASGKTRTRMRTTAVRVQGNDVDDNRALYWRAMSDEEEDCEGARKKLRLSKEQTAVLEQSFQAHSTLNPKLKMALARRLNVTPRQVEVWFQNRRARTKLKKTEVECEFLRRCCERLAEENKQLQEEVEELRAQQKLTQSPRFCMHMAVSPATLSMCPSCDRISVDPGSAAAISVDAADHHQFLPIPAPRRPSSRIDVPELNL